MSFVRPAGLSSSARWPHRSPRSASSRCTGSRSTSSDRRWQPAGLHEPPRPRLSAPLVAQSGLGVRAHRHRRGVWPSRCTRPRGQDSAGSGDRPDASTPPRPERAMTHSGTVADRSAARISPAASPLEPDLHQATDEAMRASLWRCSPLWPVTAASSSSSSAVGCSTAATSRGAHLGLEAAVWASWLASGFLRYSVRSRPWLSRRCQCRSCARLGATPADNGV